MDKRSEALLWPAKTSLKVMEWGGQRVLLALRRTDELARYIGGSFVRLRDPEELQKYREIHGYEIERRMILDDNKKPSHRHDVAYLSYSQQLMESITRKEIGRLQSNNIPPPRDFVDQARVTLSRGVITRDDYALTEQLQAQVMMGSSLEGLETSADIPLETPEGVDLRAGNTPKPVVTR